MFHKISRRKILKSSKINKLRAICFKSQYWACNSMPCIGISDSYVNTENVQFSIQFDSIDPPTFPFLFLKKSKRASGQTGLFPDHNTIVELQRKYISAIRLVHNLKLEVCLSVRTLLTTWTGQHHNNSQKTHLKFGSLHLLTIKLVFANKSIAHTWGYQVLWLSNQLT